MNSLFKCFKQGSIVNLEDVSGEFCEVDSDGTPYESFSAFKGGKAEIHCTELYEVDDSVLNKYNNTASNVITIDSNKTFMSKEFIEKSK